MNTTIRKMTGPEVLDQLRKCDALLMGIHVSLTPKQGQYWHSDGYVEKDSVTKHPLIARCLYQAMAADWLEAGIDVVVGPATGAIAIAQGVALALSEVCGREVLAVYTEPENPADKNQPHLLKRGFDRDVSNKTILVTEDILTSGGSAERTVKAVRVAGGNILGVTVIANRGNVTTEQVGSVPRLSALTTMTGVKMEKWLAVDCPLCRAFKPLRTDIGSGRVWLETPEGQAWLASGGSRLQFSSFR